MIPKIINYVILSLAIGLTVTSGFSQNTSTSKGSTTKTAAQVFPQPIGYISDFEGILTEQQEQELTLLLKKHEQETTDQIAIVTLASLKPYDNINDYSLDLANYWGIGQKDKNNGALIALGKGLRNIRIQNGYGIESRLTETETKKIVDEIMIPQFKAGNYYEGLKKGLKAIIEELK